jgi:hypothetical protein
MDVSSIHIDKLNPDTTAAWLIVLVIALLEFHHIKDLMVFLFMKLYQFFIQRNAMNL